MLVHRKNKRRGLGENGGWVRELVSGVVMLGKSELVEAIWPRTKR